MTLTKLHLHHICDDKNNTPHLQCPDCVSVNVIPNETLNEIWNVIVLIARTIRSNKM